MVCNLDFSEHSDFSNKVSVENKHFLVLRFKYVLAELHGCARRRELSLIANKIWFFIHPRNFNLGSTCPYACPFVFRTTEHDLIAGSDVDPPKFPTILKKQEMLTPSHGYVIGQAEAIS